MVVCHCEAINDRCIRSLVGDQATTTADIVARCGAGSRCGGCVDSIQALLDRLWTEQLLTARLPSSS